MLSFELEAEATQMIVEAEERGWYNQSPAIVKPTMKWDGGDNTLLLLAQAALVLDKANHTLGAYAIRREINCEKDECFTPGTNYCSFLEARELVLQHINLI